MNKIKKQSEVAQELNVSPQYISAILLGKKSCNEKIMNKLNKYYNLQWVQKTKVLNTYKVLGDKEIEEIPQFKGTLEKLDGLSILGDKENE